MKPAILSLYLNLLRITDNRCNARSFRAMPFFMPIARSHRWQLAEVVFPSFLPVFGDSRRTDVFAQLSSKAGKAATPGPVWERPRPTPGDGHYDRGG